MKGKRSKRSRYRVSSAAHFQGAENSVSEEEDMAICLVMLEKGVNTRKSKDGDEESANSGSRDMKEPVPEPRLDAFKIMKKRRIKTVEDETEEAQHMDLCSVANANKLMGNCAARGFSLLRKETYQQLHSSFKEENNFVVDLKEKAWLFVHTWVNVFFAEVFFLEFKLIYILRLATSI